jgi:recombination protein RecT
MSEVAIREKTQGLIATIQSDAFRERIRVLLPDTVGLDKFLGIAATAFLENPDLSDADPNTVMRGLLACADDGLLPNGRQAALVVFNTKVGNEWVKQASYLPMVQGIIYKLGEYGWHVSAHVVKENDLIWEVTSEPPNIHHRELTVGDRGANIAVYAVARHRSGTRIQRVLYPPEVAKRRAISKRQKAWDDWTDQYWEKTVVHDVADDLPLDPKERERIVGILQRSDELEPSEATALMYGRDTLNPKTGELTASPASAPVEEPDTNGTPSDGVGFEGDQGHDANPHSPVVPLVLTEADEVAALEASLFKAPGGKYGPDREGGALSLGEIHALGAEGNAYLRLMLEKGKAGEYRDAIESFTRSAMPEVYAEIMGRRGEA